MRVRILAQLAYRYTEEVTQARIQARLSPAATARQLVLAHPLSADPTGWHLSYEDYWGTRVTEIEVADPHETFSLSLLSDVNLTGVAGAALAEDFARLNAVGVEDSFAEFLTPTSLCALSAEQADAARSLREASTTPTDLVESLAKELSAGDGRDDLTHLTIGALRSVGVPARFVSGYRAPFFDFEPGTSVPGVITSWLDYWDGAWQGWDPAAIQPVGDRHVIIGWGRERSDCPPLRGIYCGPGESECVAEVTVTRLA